MIPAVLANKFDIIVASMSITAARLEKIDFSIPYRVSIGQFVAPKSAKLALFNADNSVNVAGFKGVRVGLQRAQDARLQRRQHEGKRQHHRKGQLERGMKKLVGIEQQNQQGGGGQRIHQVGGPSQGPAAQDDRHHHRGPNGGGP